MRRLRRPGPGADDHRDGWRHPPHRHRRIDLQAGTQTSTCISTSLAAREPDASASARRGGPLGLVSAPAVGDGPLQRDRAAARIGDFNFRRDSSPQSRRDASAGAHTINAGGSVTISSDATSSSSAYGDTREAVVFHRQGVRVRHDDRLRRRLHRRRREITAGGSLVLTSGSNHAVDASAVSLGAAYHRGQI